MTPRKKKNDESLKIVPLKFGRSGVQVPPKTRTMVEVKEEPATPVATHEGLAHTEGCENVAATPIKRPRGRPKAPTISINFTGTLPPGPIPKKYITKTTQKRRADSSVSEKERKKKRPAPKSRTMLEVKKKPANPVATHKGLDPTEGTQVPPKSRTMVEVKEDPAIPVATHKGLAPTEGCENVTATPIKRPLERPKASSSIYINLEKVLENSPNSVTSNKLDLTTNNFLWTKDISNESSISSNTSSSDTVTSSFCVRFNNKHGASEKLKNQDQLNMSHDIFIQRYLSETSRSKSSSSKWRPSSSSTSDSKLFGINTKPKDNRSTSFTPKLPLSDLRVNLCSKFYKLWQMLQIAKFQNSSELCSRFE